MQTLKLRVLRFTKCKVWKREPWKLGYSDLKNEKSDNASPETAGTPIYKVQAVKTRALKMRVLRFKKCKVWKGEPLKIRVLGFKNARCEKASLKNAGSLI